MKKAFYVLVLPLVLAAFFTGCPGINDDYTVQAVKIELNTSGQTAVDAEGEETSVTVSFTGAGGLDLSPADFTVSGEGASISGVAVEGDTAVVTVTFGQNDSGAEKTYTVGISEASEKIKGEAVFTIIHGYMGDTRVLLTAGEAVSVEATETSAGVTFTGASGLAGIETSDFTIISGEAEITGAAVADGTVTVTIAFSANDATAEKTYSVGISSSSETVKGSGAVTVAQGGKDFLTAYYVSFSTGNDDNPGTEAAPWKTIAKVNAQTFNPGDAILFRKGDTWTWDSSYGASDFLAPKGSGTAENVISIGTYGSGDKPKLEGAGLVNNVIRLHNQQYWKIGGLEITNTVEGFTNPMAKNETLGGLLNGKDLRGILISGNRGGTLEGLTLHDLYIHDVTGVLAWIGNQSALSSPNPYQKSPGATYDNGWDGSKRTGGILIESQKNDDGSQPDTPTIFNNVLVENNRLERNSFGAFTIKQYNGTNGDSSRKWAQRLVYTYPYTDSNFKPHTNIIVRGNYIDQTGWYKGNGLYITSTKGALIEKNVIKNSGVCGIETFFADDIVIQYNDVSGSTAKGEGSDSNAIDPDRCSSNIIIQYNYVHENGDGIMMCGYSYNTVILRYNVLYDNTGWSWFRDNVDNGYMQVYNNIIYNTRNQHVRVSTSASGSNDIWEFKNNVIYSSNPSATAEYAQGSNWSYSNNLYYGFAPPAKDAEAIVADPRFTGVPAFSTGSTGNSAADRFGDFSPFRPASGSPLINTGLAYTRTVNKIDIQINNLDYDGAALSGKADIGLYAASFNGLRGIVVNDMDEQISNAAITLAPETGTPLVTTSGSDGGYFFPNVPDGTYTLSVTAVNHQGSETSLAVNGDTPSWQILSPGPLGNVEPRTITGTIREGSTALPGVAVVISKNGGTVAETASGADGSYSLTGIPYGDGYTITASKTGYVSQTVADFQVPAFATIDPVDFTLVSSTHVYYDEQFNVGSLDDWAVVDGGHTVEIIADPDDPANGLLHIYKSDGTAAVGIYNKDYAGAYGVFTIETRMKRGTVPSSYGQFHLYTYDAAKTFTSGDGANSAANIAMERDIRTHFTTGSSATTTVQTYTANTWYRITLRVDISAKTFSFYVDGTLKGSGGLRTAVDKIDIFNICAGQTGTFGDFWVDYIKVYQGEPQFPSGE